MSSTLKIGRIPEDRNEEGVIGEMAIWENTVLERIASPAFSRRGFVNRKAGMAFAREIIDGFDVRGGGPAIRTRLLSGGNMQKLILGRNLHRRPRISDCQQPRAVSMKGPWRLSTRACSKPGKVPPCC